MLGCALRLKAGVSKRTVTGKTLRTVLVSREIAVEVISGRLCMELLADARDVLFGESRS